MDVSDGGQFPPVVIDPLVTVVSPFALQNAMPLMVQGAMTAYRFPGHRFGMLDRCALTMALPSVGPVPLNS